MYCFTKWMIFIGWLSWNYTKINSDSYYAKKLKDYLESLGILGIKLGQYLCNRQDICSNVMKRELEVFLSNNPIHSIEHTNATLKKWNVTDLTIGEVIGSGSLTQVYTCYKKGNDNKLVLKIKHPEIDSLKTEITTLKRIIYMMSWVKKYKFVLNVDWDNFFNMVEKQIDMNNEIVNMKKYYSIYYKDNIAQAEGISVPEFIEGNEDYILMSFCEGKPLNCLPRDSDVYRKAHNLFTCSTIHTFFMHRIIHGDIHEGNILVQENGNISMIDFGICINLKENEYKGLFAATQFDGDPTEENCYKFLSTIIKPLDIYNKEFDIKEVNKLIYMNYIEIHKQYEFPPALSDLFDVVIVLMRKYNLLIRGETLSYFLNFILLEGLYSNKEVMNPTTFIATEYMMKDKFFSVECEAVLEDYNALIRKKLPQFLIEKYSALV
jgi:predicted unusual protein kinase regulating ubiquinone biosynthesis (AarF/ABC1/UbiB family)